MTITARQVHTLIQNELARLRQLDTRLPAAVTAAHQTLIDGPDQERATDAGVKSKNTITDPTGNTAVNHLANNQRIFELLEAQVETLQITLTLMVQFCDRWTPIDIDRQICHGGRTIDDWADPLCGNIVEHDTDNRGNRHYRSSGLCVSCRKRRERWERDQQVVA